MTTSTFHVRTDADLQLPLMTAVADAEKSGATRLEIKILPGTYKSPLVLRPPTAPEKLGFSVEPEGSGVVVMTGTIAITGATVTLRGIVVDGARPAATAVSIQAFQSVDIANLALVGVRGSTSGGERDPLLDLVARAKGAKATIRDLWIVDCSAGSAPLIRIPANGPGRWASVEFANIALVGNRGSVGIAATSTDALSIKGAFVIDPALTDAWLHLNTFGAIAIDHATIAVRADLVDHGDDTGYPKPVITASELYAAKPAMAIDAHDVTWHKPPGATIDPAAAATAARANTAPDRTKLIAGVRLAP